MARLTVNGAVLALAAVLIASATLSGCGFRPMHASAEYGGPEVGQTLAAVEIPGIGGRVGQRVRNEIVYDIKQRGGDYEAPNYRLEIRLRDSITAIAVQQTGKATSEVYNLIASFKLYRISNNEVLLKGVSRSKASLDRFEPEFSNLRARRDAENRAAKEIAESIRTRVSAFLSTEMEQS